LVFTYSKLGFNLNKLYKINEKYEKQSVIKKIAMEQKEKLRNFVELKKYDSK